MGVASWSFDLVWAVGGSGPAGGVAARGKQGGWLVLWCLACVVGAGVGLVAWCWHRRHARCCLVWWWWVPLLLGVACCRGSGAVRPGCLARFFCFSVCWRGGGGCGWVGCELYSGREHLTVRFLRQMFLVLSCVLLFVFLSVRWMPWHQGPMKDVVACDKPRGAGWRAVIRGVPNGGTRHELCRVTCI